VLERVRKLEEKKIIRGYATLVEPQRVGLGLVAFVLLTLTRHTGRLIQRFQRSIMNLPEVLECYHLAGEGDFLLKVVHRDISAYRDFLIGRLTALEGVKRVRTLIVFDTLKQSSQMPLPAGTKEK
jgi:DNA-binding Lrp family transcriptional regulator